MSEACEQVTRTVGLICWTYTFNLHGFPILDSAREGDIRMPSIVKLRLFLGGNIQGDLADITDLRQAHV